MLVTVVNRGKIPCKIVIEITHFNKFKTFINKIQIITKLQNI